MSEHIRNCHQSTIPLEKKLLLTIWTLANQEPFRAVGDRFGLNRGTAHKCFMEVCRCIRKNLYQPYIKWPATTAECQHNADEFETRYSFPGCVGCIDGSHIPIKPPANDRDSYINRKGFPSINLLAVCDQKMKFIATYAERAGSVHDARVFRVSELGRKAVNNELFPSKDFHLLADSAYALMPQVIVPFRDNGHLTHQQKTFNVRQSATRSVIERAFGRLKGKFRRLRGLDVTRTDFGPMVIETACILHNVIITEDDTEDDDEADEVAEAGAQQTNDSSGTNGLGECSSRDKIYAKLKRDNIMFQL